MKTRLFPIAVDESAETYAAKLIEYQAGAMTRKFEALSETRQAEAQQAYFRWLAIGFTPESAMVRVFEEFGI